MAVKRGLGIGKDSIFKNTLKESSQELNNSVVVEEISQQKKWIKYSTWITPENKQKIDELSFFDKKEKRQVLNDIIEFYIKNNK